MAGRLEGKVAIVTGGGSGIGRAISQRFAAEGAAVSVFDISAAGAGETVTAIEGDGGRARAVTCDVAAQSSVCAAFDDVESSCGGIDILINNAGVAHVGTAETTTETEMDRVYSVNVKGVYNCLHFGIPALKRRGGGAILNLASIASLVGLPDRFAYSMSKGAVAAMTHSVAADLVSDNIRCNAVAPGRVHTPFVDGFIAKNYPGQEQVMFEKLSKTQPIGRMGQPEEIAELALFLCGDDSQFITGSIFPIDGGFTSLKI